MRFNIWVTSLPMTTIALLVLTTNAIAETGLKGSYVGVPVDIKNLLNSSSTPVPTPDHLVNAAMNQALKSTGITPEFNPTPPTATGSVGAQFQGRYDLPASPLSVRGSVYLGDNAKAIMPMVTYDIPIGGSTNLYAGAGVAVVDTGTRKTTPLGTRTGVVVTTGLESEISKGIVLYGDAKWLSGNKGTDTPPLRYQLGVGYRF
ncbi:MAG: outer membrane beta-barrel protein [Oscillatoriales cyanobacterium C42_A2020_001]|nr:outer membrane beta-barrel protein [Leptolyngbyaceae cyanobacterium C42_A2020_001]